jgi:hypothetical protein
MSGPLDNISQAQMNQPVGKIYIVSGHGCRTGGSFDVEKNISVVTTSEHQYKASSPTGVMGRGPLGTDTYSVIEPTKSIGQNVADAKTISELIESIRNSIVPQVDPATKKHPLSKGTRAVIKMRNSDSQPMTIPESRLFVAGKKISGFEGVFFVNSQTRGIEDVSEQFGLTKRDPEDRKSGLLKQTSHDPKVVDYYNGIIGHLKHEVEQYNEVIKSGSITEQSFVDQLRRYIQGKKFDIQMLEIELKNESVLGKYKYVAQSMDGTTSVERDVLFSDIANHSIIRDGDVIILHVCNGICDEHTSLSHGEPAPVRMAKLVAFGRTLSGSTGQTGVKRGLVYHDDTPPSDGEGMGGGNSKLKTKKNNNIKMKKYKRLTVKRRALRRKLRRSHNRSYRKSYRI